MKDKIAGVCKSLLRVGSWLGLKSQVALSFKSIQAIQEATGSSYQSCVLVECSETTLSNFISQDLEWNRN